MKDKQYDCFSLINKTHILYSNFEDDDEGFFKSKTTSEKWKNEIFIFDNIFKGDSDDTCFNIK